MLGANYNIDHLFSSPIREGGSEKLVDFVAEFQRCCYDSKNSEILFFYNHALTG